MWVNRIERNRVDAPDLITFATVHPREMSLVQNHNFRQVLISCNCVCLCRWIKKEMAHRMLRWEKNILRSVVYWSGKWNWSLNNWKSECSWLYLLVVYRRYLFSLYSLCFVLFCFCSVFNGKDESWPTQSLRCWNDWFCVWECSCKYCSWGFPIKH